MIDLTPLRGKRYFIYGLGKSGVACAQAMRAAGVDFSAWDDDIAVRDAFLYPDVLHDPLSYGLQTYDALVLSPGVPDHVPVVQAAHQAGSRVICDTDLLFVAHPDAPVIGITGTNGKSTTTALIAHILAGDRKVAVGGNLGQPTLSLDGGADTHFVIEFSSFMLARVPHLKTDVGILLNITPDHLDWHGGMAAYCAAKANLFKAGKGAKTALIGVDDPDATAIFDDVRAARQMDAVPVSVTRGLSSGYSAEDGILRRDGAVLCDLNAHPRLKGRHNHQNMAFAYAACAAVGASHDMTLSRMMEFQGLPHRQFVARTINGIPYINDSKATNADATVQALAAYDGIYWLAGGKPKATGLKGCEGMFPRVRHAYLYGYAAQNFAEFCTAQGLPHTVFETMEQALNATHARAQADANGGAVLLSPACASYDQFKNFEERGDLFCRFVQSLH